MTDDDDDDRDREARVVRTLREARNNVRRLKREPADKRRDEFERQSPEDIAKTLLPLPMTDPVARWRMEADEAIAARERAKEEIRSQSTPRVDYDAIDERVLMLIERDRNLMCESLGKAVGELLNEERVDTMRAMRDELRSLKIEIAKYASEVAALREALTVERGRVVDLPPLPRRSVN